MDYIARDIEKLFKSVSHDYAAVLLTGTRGVGKTTMLRHLAESGRGYVTLDDLFERDLAQRDPAMFLSIHKPPVIIEEVHHAPQLFTYLKMAVDAGAPKGSYWLTSSRASSGLPSEISALAGRVAILTMAGMSQHELHGIGELVPFGANIVDLQKMAEQGKAKDLEGLYERIWSGSLLPQDLIVDERKSAYSQYLSDLIYRDIAAVVPKIDAVQMANFMAELTQFIGRPVDHGAIAAKLGVKRVVVRRWLSALEQVGVIFYLYPITRLNSKRRIRQPKLYFSDTGFAAYLARYPTPEVLQFSEQNIVFLENYGIGEFCKHFGNLGKNPWISFYEDVDGRNQIDLILHENGVLWPIQFCRCSKPSPKAIESLEAFKTCGQAVGQSIVFCMTDTVKVDVADRLIASIWSL